MVIGALRRPGQDQRRASTDPTPRAIAAAIRPITETLVAATPLIFAGLAVAISFRSGVFNIGVEGQFVLGAFGAAVVAIAPQGPAGAADPDRRRPSRACSPAPLWGFIPGVLKAKTGAHEVITTIMLNYVAAQIVLFGLRSDFLRKEGSSQPISKVLSGLRPRPADLRPAGDPAPLGLRGRAADGGAGLVVPVQDDQGLRAACGRASTCTPPATRA